MFRNYFELVTDWTLAGSLDEVDALVANAVADPSSVVRAWPTAFLDARVRKPGAADGRGQVVALRTRGFLPYSLDWEVELVEARRRQRYVQVATGDFAGIATWSVAQTSAGVRVRLEWRLRVEKRLLRRLLFLLKPLFAWNHRWAMARGRESLDRELVRRRALGTAAA
jgi:hypothetical protein